MPAPPPVNRDAVLVSREPLDGPYVILTVRHAEVARAARAGQFVMIKAGVSAAPPLRPRVVRRPATGLRRGAQGLLLGCFSVLGALRCFPLLCVG